MVNSGSMRRLLATCRRHNPNHQRDKTALRDRTAPSPGRSGRAADDATSAAGPDAHINHTKGDQTGQEEPGKCPVVQLGT